MQTFVSRSQIEHLLNSAETEEAILWEKELIVSYKLPDGFSIVGRSACVDPSHFNLEMGRFLCRRDAEKQLWQLEGYLLQWLLYQSPEIWMQRIDEAIDHRLGTGCDRALLGLAPSKRFTLPDDHWIYETHDCPEPIASVPPGMREAVVNAARFALSGATEQGQNTDFDPGAFVLNLEYALLGPKNRCYLDDSELVE